MDTQLTNEHMGRTASQISRLTKGEHEDARTLVIDGDGDAVLTHIGRFGTLWTRKDGSSVALLQEQ